MTINSSFRTRICVGSVAFVAAIAVALGGTSAAQAAEAPVDLYTADSYAVLAGSTITNTGSTTITGDVGLHPGTAITGLLPIAVTGTIHAADAAALQAKNDLTTAFNDAAGRSPSPLLSPELGGLTLDAGTYSGDTLAITGTLTLRGDASSVFVFQAASTLITATSSVVSLISSAGTVNACNVFWKVGSSATLGTTSTMVGTVMASESITANNGAAVQGRLLAGTGAVTLNNNQIVASTGCASAATAATTARLNAEAATAAQAAADAATAAAAATAAQQAADEAARLTAEQTAADEAAAAELASTGFDPIAPLITTVALLGVGSYFVLVGRRRARTS